MTPGTDPSPDVILETLVERGVIPAGDVRIERATGGLNSRVYYVSGGDGQPLYTVRTSRPGRVGLLEREAAVLTKLDGTCCCTPAMVGFIPAGDNDGQAILVHHYAPGSPADPGSISSARIEQAGTCLARLHAHTTDHYAIWPALVEVRGTRAQAYAVRVRAITRYPTLDDASNPTLHRRLQYAFQRLEGSKLRGDGWDETSFALLHGDLSQGNLIWDDDQLTLIDWEYHRPGDPAEDLAYLLAEQEIPQERVDEFFRSYIASGGDATAISRVPDFAALVSLDSALWWAEYHRRMGIDPATAAEVEHHLNRAIQSLPRSSTTS